MVECDCELSFDLVNLLKGSWGPLGVYGLHFENDCSKVMAPLKLT